MKIQLEYDEKDSVANILDVLQVIQKNLPVTILNGHINLIYPGA